MLAIFLSPNKTITFNLFPVFWSLDLFPLVKLLLIKLYNLFVNLNLTSGFVKTKCPYLPVHVFSCHVSFYLLAWIEESYKKGIDTGESKITLYFMFTSLAWNEACIYRCEFLNIMYRNKLSSYLFCHTSLITNS